jgi:glycosyltransferase involved in cell wall biosynthesis
MRARMETSCGPHSHICWAAMSAPAVLHVTSLPGGGVDRHIRDIARSQSRRHLVWHVSDSVEVIEILGVRRCFPLSGTAFAQGREALAAWLRRQGVGLVHAHSVSAPARMRVEWALGALGTRALATLHDVLFLRPDGFEPGASSTPDPQWLAQTRAFLARMEERIAPSNYLAGVARAHLGAQSVVVVANGSPPRPPVDIPRAPRADYAARPFEHVALVLGSIGPHKGARVLEETAALLAGSGIGIVVVGYLDAQVDPGWRGPNIYIHGAYGDEEVAALAAAYRAEVALFPNQVPESFSYALSDTWQAGLPAVVPPEGALGERVGRHGGWLLPEGFEAADVANALRELLLGERRAEVAQVKSALQSHNPERIPPLEAMTRSLDALYARFGLETAGPVDPQSAPAQELLALNLDGALFRQELARVADELAQVKHAIEVERTAAAAYKSEASGWIAKVEGDVATLQEDIGREVAARRTAGEEAAQLANQVQDLARYKAAFDLLPRPLRSLLLRRIDRARG